MAPVASVAQFFAPMRLPVHCLVLFALCAAPFATAADSGGLPWAVVDKRNAVLQVFRADGTLAGQTVVLLGADRGDGSVPGVDERTQAGTLRPGDRTTPAGRFISQPGVNLAGEALVWVDYDAAFAIHPLRSGASQASRRQRLSSADPARRRASAGCVVVPPAFFDSVVRPVLGRGPAVVWVLRENESRNSRRLTASATTGSTGQSEPAQAGAAP